MSPQELEPRIIRMPELAGQWLNVDRPPQPGEWRGQPVLVDFWDYTCVNCLRTLPYLRLWHERYAPYGLRIVGVHAPEFSFARLRDQVAGAITDLSIPYPVILDNDYRLWDAFAVRAWPTKFLADRDGYLRFSARGEGRYEAMESAIQQLLRPMHPEAAFPGLLPPLRAEDRPGAVCYRPTPEIYAGYRQGGLFTGTLGNPEGYTTEGPVFYRLPEPERWAEGRFYLEGVWRAWPEAVSFAGTTTGKVVLPYSALNAYAVLSPSADPVETILGLANLDAEPVIEVRQDGRPLSGDVAGADVARQPDGRSVVYVTRPRMYELVRNRTFEPHELELTFQARNLALYTFTFTACVAEGAAPDAVETFEVQ